MTRIYNVYTLSGDADMQTAIEALSRTQDDLPEGAFQQLCRRNDPEIAGSIRWVPFGDIVQILDFPLSSQAQDFESSPAGAAQRRRTRHMFSNVAALSCPTV